MHRKYSNFLIVLFIGVSLLGVYYYFYNDTKSEASSSTDSITSSLDTSSMAGSVSTNDAKINEDISFLTKLITLKTIQIDTSLFQNQSFNKLVDNKIKLESVPFGRTNPFAPIDKVANNQNAFNLLTKSATMISTKSATLSGSIEGASSTNVYFEYGTTETFGKVTPKITPSMVGDFTTTVTGLSSGTTYFFRIAANINGTKFFGNVMSFNTN